MSKVSFSMEVWLKRLAEFETCPLKPLLQQILKTEITADNITFFDMIMTMIEKHEADLRAQRQEISSIIMKHKGKHMISRHKT